MSVLHASVSRVVLALLAAGVAAPLQAADIVVPDNTTVTGQKTFGGTDKITVGTGGVLTSSANPTLNQTSAATGVVIDNSGTIESTGTGTRAIRFNSGTSMSFTLTNEAGATIQSQNDALNVGQNVSAGTIVVNNYGTIQATGVNGNNGQAIDFGAIAAGTASVTINNYKTGLIQTADADAIRPGNNATINNYGQIISNNYQTNSGADGIDFQANASGTVNNYGTISGGRHGINLGESTPTASVTVTNYADGQIIGHNGSGFGSDAAGTVVNYGLISGRIDAIPGVANGDGDGVDIDYIATITNYGRIEGTGAKGVGSDGLPNSSEGVAVGGGTIVNGDASHRTAVISGANNGILADNSSQGDAFGALSITNYGTIEGLDGYGIRYVNSGADPSRSLTIVNYGAISGTTYAVQMGGGDDLFVYGTGSSVKGIVDAEGGVDTLQLGRSGDNVTFDVSLLGAAATYRNFERVTAEPLARTTLTGTSSFAGDLVFDRSYLELDHASLAKASLVLSGDGSNAGALAGSGTLYSLSASGTVYISPGVQGAPFGTIAVVGNGALAGTYQVDVATDGRTDLVTIGGKASISAGTGVEMYGTLAWSRIYTILSSDTHVFGTFAGLNVVDPIDYLFVAPELSYDDKHVYLALERNGTAFANFAQTRNQLSVVGALEAVGQSDRARASALYGAFVTQTGSDNPTLALAQLSGDIHAALPGQIATENMLVNDLVLGRVRQADYTGTRGAAAALGSGGPARAYAEPSSPAAGAFKAVKAPADAPVWTGWAQGYGQWLSTDSDGNAAAVDTHVGGLLIGGDVSFANGVFGLAGGYSSASTSTNFASADTETWRIAAYGGVRFDAIKLRAGASYGWSSIDTSRFVALTGEAPRASYDGTAGNLFGEAAYTFALGAVALEPFAGIGWTSVDLGSFVENGAPVAGLTSQGSSFDTAYTTLGLRLASTFAAGNGIDVTPHASAGWRHAFGDVVPQAALAFVNTGTAFGIEGLPIAQDSLVASIGLDIAFATGVTLSLAYDGMAGDGASYNAGKAALSVKF